MAPKINPPSMRYPFEADIGHLHPGVQRAHRFAFNAIVDLQSGIGALKSQITTLQQTAGTSTTTATKPVADPPLIVSPEIGITPIPVAGRQGNAPTGGTSANSGATGATNSSYRQGAYIAGVNPQTSATAYTVQDTDYNGTIVFNSATTISVALNSAVNTNYACNVMNVGKGNILVSPLIISLAAGGAGGYLVGDVLTMVQGGAAGGTALVTSVSGGAVTGLQLASGGTGYVVASGLATTGGAGAGATINIIQTGTVNQGTSVSLQSGAFTVLSFDGLHWWAMSFTGVLPQTFAKVAHQWLDSYSANTGTFTASQPAFTDISGVADPAQLPLATAATFGVVKPDNVTITIAAGVITAVAGGAVPSFADAEVPSGAIDGINVTFTLAHSPNPPKSLILPLAGQIQFQDAGGDYTLAAGAITFATAPTVGPLLAWYRY